MLSSYKYSFDNNKAGKLHYVENMGLLNEFCQMIVLACVRAYVCVWFCF